MAIELVTGYQGKDHVTAEQWADFNRGIFGDAAILPIGNRMETAIQTANQISVKDGVAVFDGRQVYIGYGESDNIAITSGTQGMLRRDIVVVEYTREEDTGIESVQFKVVNGTPAASNAKDPSVQDMDIRTGVFVSQKPFCRVRLNGTAIEGVDSLVQVKEFKDHAFADPVNNLTGTNPGLALAATQGKALKQLIDQLNSALATRRMQTYIAATQLGLTDENNLQEICYALPICGIFFCDCGIRSESGWKHQLPTDYGTIKIEKLYSTRVTLFWFPISAPENYYIATYSENNSPGFSGWYKYSGVKL